MTFHIKLESTIHRVDMNKGTAFVFNNKLLKINISTKTINLMKNEINIRILLISPSNKNDLNI